ncbi:MAG: DNA translocase FtsK 4TM domain-containing protein [Ruminococcus sp.]|nr:DNA translocase FtsK 4TM domain-containing protein [Ruminococcus sp.]
MAETKKSSPGGDKKPSGENKAKGSSGGKGPRTFTPGTHKLKAPEPKNQQNQFWSIVLFALGVVVLLLAVIEGAAGWNGIHNFLLGMFGISAFVLPVVFFYSAISIGLEKGKEDVTGRAGWGVAMILLVASAIQIIGVGNLPGEGFFGRFPALYDQGKDLKGGGVLSIIIAGPLLKLFGTTGAQIITIIMFFVFGMLMTGKGIMQFFELLARPFVFIWNCLEGVKNMLTGGDFEDAFDDDDDDNEEDDQPVTEIPESAEVPPIEEIHQVKNEPEAPPSEESTPPPEEKKPRYHFSDSLSSPEFLFDVPIPGENRAEDGTKLPDEPVFVDENGIPQPPVQSLEELISQAAGLPLPSENTEEVSGETPEEEPEEPAEPPKPVYQLPSLELLTPPDGKSNSEEAAAEMRDKAATIVNTLDSFGVKVRISDIYRGPAITRYEIQPGAGVKVSKIKGLEDDIALYLAAQGVRIEAPVPGKAAVGIEVPNTNKDMVTLREILSAPEFKEAQSKLTFAVGKDIAGNVVLGDIAKMPHVIIAGTTGSGKSVCTRSIIMSILYNATPDEVKVILIDPKIVEFKIFEGIPHLLIPIVTDSKKAAGALNWAVNEMMRRYQMFADDGANDIKSYNALAENNPEIEKIPQIVIFIDELADMMLVAGKEVEDSICRLAQMGRAAGMHLVVATQRPTTDVITGLIKANIPSRIALSVMSQVDSRTIIDMAGADKLLGNGDMLYMPIGSSKPVRVQGCFASTKDIEATLKFIKEQVQGEYDNDIVQAVESLTPVSKNEKDESAETAYAAGSDEDFIERAMDVAVDAGQLSTSMLQRKLKLGYARAARIMDELEEQGIIGPSEGAKPRKVLISRMQLDERRAKKSEENKQLEAK